MCTDKYLQYWRYLASKAVFHVVRKMCVKKKKKRNSLPPSLLFFTSLIILQLACFQVQPYHYTNINHITYHVSVLWSDICSVKHQSVLYFDVINSLHKVVAGLGSHTYHKACECTYTCHAEVRLSSKYSDFFFIHMVDTVIESDLPVRHYPIQSHS